MTAKPATLSQVRIDRVDGVATLFINRPDQLNTVTPALVQQLRWAFDELTADKDVQAIVIAGEGKVFSIGAEIGFLLRCLDTGDMKRIMAVTYAAHELLNAIDDCPKPVIARLHATTIGAGVEIALACDRIVACPGTTLSFPETGLGIFPCLGGTQRTLRAIGPGLAKWLMYTGKTLSAADALRIGMIDDIVSPAELDAACRDHALGRRQSRRPRERPEPFERIAQFFETHRVTDLHSGEVPTSDEPVVTRTIKSIPSKGRIALQFVERLIDEGARLSQANGLQREIDLVHDIYHTADAHRGLAYRSRKALGAPVFEGR